MYWGRLFSSCAATAAVAGCVVLAVGMSHGPHPDASAPRSTAVDAQAAIPATKSFAGDSASAASASTRTTSSAPTPSLATSSVPAPSVPTAASTRATVGTPSATAVVSPAVNRAAPNASVAPAVRPAASPASSARRTVAAAAPAKGSTLPVHYSTGTATRVITVTARSTGSTTATVQAWTKVAAGRWSRVGPAIPAHIGSDGMSTHASESRSATPMGTFTLTQAFGRDSDPGTALPYFRTTPSDYWISDRGSRYNTHQRCSDCGYDDGTNERLYYVTPQYNYAVVIDYNTRNAPGGVKQGRGSAFFLHVTDGSATAGCVAIPQSRLVSIMKWLAPSTHPRILIGTG